MSNNELIDLVLKLLDQTPSKHEEKQTIINQIAAINMQDIGRIPNLMDYMQADGLVTFQNTIGYGYRIYLTPKAIKLLHEYNSYSKYDKAQQKTQWTAYNITMLLIAALSFFWAVYSTFNSNQKDIEGQNLKDTIRVQATYIRELRKTITEKEAMIDVYNRSNPPTAKTDK